MKNSILLLLLFTGLANAQIVSIPDANLKANLLSASPTVQLAQDFGDQWVSIDTNNDGEIQVSEAQAIKFLTVSTPLLTDITGLTSFNNLKTLNFRFNQMPILDLNAMTSLTSLSFVNMPQTVLLNINNLTNLTELYAIGLTSLTNLNVSNLTNLTKLNVFYCLLNSLDVSNLTNLTLLNCSGNQLTNLNVSALTNLTGLDCSYNNIATLNVNGLTNLSILYCSNNRLLNLNGIPNVTKLDCSNNKLTSFTVNSLSNLSELNCSGNEIASLNVDALTSLTKLDCGYNKITNLNISNLPNLTNLDCNGNHDLTAVTLSNLIHLQDFSIVGLANGQQGQLNSLTLNGLPALQKLFCSNSQLTSLSLDNLTNLTDLDCSTNQITSLTLTNLPNLKNLMCATNPINSLDVSGLPNLETLTCANGYIVDGQITGNLHNLNVTGLSHLKTLNCGNNLLSSLDLTGLTSLENLTCDGVPNNISLLTSLNVNNLTNLKMLSCANQQLTSLNVSNLTNLESLYCSYNHITSLDLTGLINLKNLDYNYNQLANLNLINLPSLESLNCSNNYLVTLNVQNLTSLKSLYCIHNSLSTLNLSGLNSLETLDYSFNQLVFSNVSGLSTNLKSLSCGGNNLASLDVSGLTNLETLSCHTNQLTSLDLSTLNNLKFLDCSINNLPNLTISNLTNLQSLSCGQNQLTDLNIAGLNNITMLSCGNNQLTNLDLSGHNNLTYLDYSVNSLPNLDVSALTNLTSFGNASTQSTTLDVSHMPYLHILKCYDNQLTTLDLNNCSYLDDADCSSNLLTTLFMKNGHNDPINFANNPTLEYICADNSELENTQTTLNGLSMSATVSNSYCTFTPGGNHNAITGIAIFDADNNGCDITDEVNPFVRFDVTDGTNTGATVTNINGTYSFYTDAGNYTIAPNVENQAWFDFSPASASYTFPDNNNNISTQNFCIAAVGTHKDIEVVIAPLEPARPGFTAQYKIVYKNKGNQMHSGTVDLTFDDNRTDFLAATPSPDNTTTNTLSWNYINLMPFENRSIILTLELNTPTETPALNNGDILDFTAAISPVAGDELPGDNQYTYHQTVVGSYDPNSIACLEGETVSPTEIGNYLHYAVNFENLGTFQAENIVVRSEIDTTKYDIETLQVMNTSHPSYTRITGNVVEFVFQNINLEAAHGNPPVGGHGDVLFKIKTKNSLVDNDMVLQRAGIYFDYNFPVATNDAETTFAALNTPGFEQDNTVKIYPNPTSSVINIQCKSDIKSIELYDVQGRILETVLQNSATATLDITTKSNGIYFLKINTDKGSKVEKIIKE